MPFNLYNLDDVEIYELLLSGKISSFPSGFWASRNETEAKDTVVKLLHYLIKVKAVKWLVKKSNLRGNPIDRNTFGVYGLSRLLADYYCDNPKRAINEAYGDSAT